MTNETNRSLESTEEIQQWRATVSGLPEGTRKTHRLYTLRCRPEVRNLEKAVLAIKNLIDEKLEKPIVMLYSHETGIGKTHLAYAAGWMMLVKNKSVAFYPTPLLLDELRRGYRESELRPEQRNGGRTYEQTMSWLERVDLLIMDDIGANKLTDWSLEKLDQIVDYRYANNLALLLTSNRIDFSDRIIDRCRDGVLIRLEGPSYRGGKRGTL